jgi:hypothetical protein
MSMPSETTEPSAAVTDDSAASSARTDSAAEAATQQAIDEQAAASRSPQAEGDEREHIKEQLNALKRREFELRRALAIAEHPELADAIRTLEGRTYAVAKAQAKLEQGLSKSEERRRDTLERKLSGLREKRATLDGQIGELDSELAALGVERTRAYEAERQAALEQLLAALGTHSNTLSAAGLEPSELVPELEAWLPEVRACAEAFVARVETPAAESAVAAQASLPLTSPSPASHARA